MLSLIVNPSAGGGHAAKVLPDVQAALSELGIEHHVERTRSLEHARELARAAAGNGEIAAALGGDGLIGAVADALKDCDGVLGVLPGGRGNDFARVLGIPLEAGAACTVLAHGESRRLDLGRVGPKTFIGIASCGFDSDANRIANETKLVRGTLVYTYGALRALASWKPTRFEVRIDGAEAHVVSGYTVAVANSKAYGGGMYMAPDASLEDGQFDVIIVGHVPKTRFLRLLPTVFKGEHVRQPNVLVLRGRTVQVSADRPFTMYADGDPIAELPVTVDVLPAAVRVMVPRGPVGDR
jgi:YegS/Rv2252/BmrU family lipid kinase